MTTKRSEKTEKPDAAAEERGARRISIDLPDGVAKEADLVASRTGIARDVVRSIVRDTAAAAAIAAVDGKVRELVGAHIAERLAAE